ncbi:TetR/AcrR family transcriptional regulator [Streptomyces soliscabiei]|uniref:TetR/AcrR family transcriptional regulator n=1 Tax=Streptomyces soliscabiei TaxID=588897 RepID=UPI0029B00452|nr:TetR/AcrR family transcriptional regulator [Streptomyces sp. NY05-11A]MDX2679240.1 TetR/AcrR family transcriptional regulator [Streptomyces sp. NY05-11A]
MSPRGVAIPELREQLFSAAEQILLRDGPQGLTGRAVTREAGCATGLLHNHFGDLEGFLTELVVEQFRVQAEAAAHLPGLAGSGSVADNLVGASMSLLESTTLAIANLVIARPSLRPRVESALAAGAPGLPEVTASLTAYLDAEKRLGRVAEAADSQAITVALIGTVHHLLLTGHASEGSGHAMVERLVQALTAGVINGADEPGERAAS